jgi:hypothetical protein
VSASSQPALVFLGGRLHPHGQVDEVAQSRSRAVAQLRPPGVDALQDDD